MSLALSWQAEQAAVIGDLASVVGSALHGAAVEQVLTITPVQGLAVVQVQGAAGVQAVLPCLPDVTPATLQGLAAVQMQGAAPYGASSGLTTVPRETLGMVFREDFGELTPDSGTLIA